MVNKRNVFFYVVLFASSYLYGMQFSLSKKEFDHSSLAEQKVYFQLFEQYCAQNNLNPIPDQDSLLKTNEKLEIKKTKNKKAKKKSYRERSITF